MTDLTKWFDNLGKLQLCEKVRMDVLVEIHPRELERVVLDYEQCPRLVCRGVHMVIKDHFTVYINGADVYIGKGDRPGKYHICVHYHTLKYGRGTIVHEGQGNNVSCYEASLDGYYLDDCSLQA